MQYEIIRLRQHPEYRERAAAWFHQKWGVPESAYLESIDACITNDGGPNGSGPAWPQWYLALAGEAIAGGLGVIENDFHDRPDLAPNVCAVYVEPEHRCKGLAGVLLKQACWDMQGRGVNTLYLITDHDSFYERYGWQFLCMVQGQDEQPLRMYVHRME